jgi:hypothetical protein
VADNTTSKASSVTSAKGNVKSVSTGNTGSSAAATSSANTVSENKQSSYSGTDNGNAGAQSADNTAVQNVSEDTASVQSTGEESNGDYTIAASGENEIAMYADEASVSKRGRARTSSDAKTRYSIASSSDISNGRIDNIKRDESDANKAITQIKISSKNAEEVVNLVLKYSYDVNGDLYSTDSEKLSMLLARLNQEGISYTDYTPAYEGNITFRLVIS